MAEAEEAALQFTPTWIVAAVCSIIVLISLAAERGLHHLGKTLKKNDQRSLYEALLKVKEELMLLGFISLLMTAFQGTIQRTCIPPSWTVYMLPCERPGDHQPAGVAARFSAAEILAGISRARVLSEGGVGAEAGLCQKEGKVPLLSEEALHQLHIFIFVLAVAHVFFSATTMLLGGAKIHKWKQWEEEIQKNNDAGNGPKKLLLAVGTKLEHIIAQLAYDVATKQTAVEGDLVVKPSDEHFWFGQPRIVLHLIHFILFQNAFELSFFFWILMTYGFHSCFMDHVGFLVPRLVLGVVIQLLCSYSTLPLYAIVTQMGGYYKKEIFNEHVQQGVLGWAEKAKKKSGLRECHSAVESMHGDGADAA